MADDDWDDEGWGERPTPMTAIAIRLEVEAVDAVRALSGDTPPAEVLRRWVLERLAAERAGDGPPAAKKKAAPAAKKTAAPAKKRKKAAAPKKAAARKRS